MSLWGRVLAAGYDTFPAPMKRTFLGRSRAGPPARPRGAVRARRPLQPAHPRDDRGVAAPGRVAPPWADPEGAADRPPAAYGRRGRTLDRFAEEGRVGVERVAEALLQAGVETAHAALGHTEHLADLAQREVLDVEQDRQLALALGQAPERAAELLLGLHARGRG